MPVAMLCIAGHAVSLMVGRPLNAPSGTLRVRDAEHRYRHSQPEVGNEEKVRLLLLRKTRVNHKVGEVQSLGSNKLFEP